jgi:hypothetical protein
VALQCYRHGVYHPFLLEVTLSIHSNVRGGNIVSVTGYSGLRARYIKRERRRSLAKVYFQQ